MDDDLKDIEKNFENLEAVVYIAIDKIKQLKQINKNLKVEVSELKRLYALSEKKAERLKQELVMVRSSDKEPWQVREKDIKQRLEKLLIKLSAFEKSYTNEN